MRNLNMPRILKAADDLAAEYQQEILIADFRKPRKKSETSFFEDLRWHYFSGHSLSYVFLELDR
jgi:hypothetical protein